MNERELRLRKLLMKYEGFFEVMDNLNGEIAEIYPEFKRPIETDVLVDISSGGDFSLIRYSALEGFADNEKTFFHSYLTISTEPNNVKNKHHFLALPDVLIPDVYYPIDYYSKEYRESRLRVFLRDGEICAKCGTKPNGKNYLTIDHIKPVSKHPELFLDEDNMQVLCISCNKNKSNKHSTDYRR